MEQTNATPETVQALLQAVGRGAFIAGGYSQQELTNWLRDGYIPALRYLEVRDFCALHGVIALETLFNFKKRKCAASSNKVTPSGVNAQ